MRRKFIHRIEVWSRAAAADNFGGQTVSDTKLSDSWCNIKTVRRDKFSDYGLSIQKKGITIRLRTRSDLDYFQNDLFFVYKSEKWYPIQITEKDLDNEEIIIVAQSE